MNKIATAKTLTSLILGLALVESFIHIVITFDQIGAGWDKWTAPFLIDTVAIIGKICTDPQFTAPVRRSGRAAFLFAGTVSLICNVAAGYLTKHYGSMIIGVIVVSAAMWAEGLVTKIAPKRTRKVVTPAPAPAPAPAIETCTVPAKPEPTAEQRAKWAEAGRKAAATRKANLAKKIAEQATPVILDVPAEIHPAGRYI